MKFYQSRLVILSTASFFMLSACKPASTPKGNIAATVNGTVISQSSVDMIAKQSTSQGQPESPEMRKNIIDRLAMQSLIAQEAVRKGLDKNPEVADQLEMIRQSILAKAFVQDYMNNNPVSDDLIKAEYEKIKAQLAGTEYKARHILVDKEAEAKDIIAELKKNAKAFSSIAKAKSKDPGSKGKGGDLGWFDPRTMVPEFGAAVTKLAKGQFTTVPVKTRYGYHIILLDDSRTRTIPAFEQVKPQVKQQLLQQNMQKLFDEMKSKAKIEVVQASSPATPSKIDPPPAMNMNGVGDKPAESSK